MKRVLVSAALLAALAACDNSQPAGGQGYFDPPPPASMNTTPISTLPPSGGVTVDGSGALVRQQPGAPRSVVTGPLGDDPNAALARDVTSVLQSTPGGQQTAATATTAPVAGQAVGPGGEPLPAGAIVPGDMGIDPNDDSINLALTPQEIQKQQREVAAQRRAAAQQQLVVVEPEPVPQQNINANVVKFARETTHPVGTKRYNRPAFRDRLQANAACRRFGTADDAQRQFLANGGPTNDRYNLDPDGDGFACSFDPEPYRRLSF